MLYDDDGNEDGDDDDHDDDDNDDDDDDDNNERMTTIKIQVYQTNSRCINGIVKRICAFNSWPISPKGASTVLPFCVFRERRLKFETEIWR